QQALHYKERMPATPIRTLIVDDEPVARHVLREELRCFPDVEIIGEAENGREAISQIGRLRPDLVFLDLKMPVMGGFEVIHQLPESAIPIIVIVRPTTRTLSRHSKRARLIICSSRSARIGSRGPSTARETCAAKQ